jgi:hypothetical protein
MTDVRLTQDVLEVVRTGQPDAQLTQVALEVLRKDLAAAVSLTGTLALVVSGVPVANALGLAPLTVSASWSLSGGTSPFTYAWAFELPEASSEASAVTPVFSAGSGVLQTSRLSALVSDASGAEVSAAALVHLRRVQTPNVFDGIFQESNQAKRRLWPT